MNTKAKHVKHLEFFRSSFNRSKCINMCGVKCQCYLWGLWLVSVDFQVYVLPMLHLKFKFFVYVSMLMFIYAYVSLVSLSFYVNVEVCVSTKVSILQSIKIKGLLRMWLKLDASLCEIYYRFLMKCFVVKLNVGFMFDVSKSLI
jgi:hypothetical protein